MSDDLPPAAPHEPSATPPSASDVPPSRRALVQGMAAAAGIATVAGFWLEGFGIPARRRAIAPTRPGAPLRFFDAATFATCVAACDRLLPSEGPESPGARDVGAPRYLDALLATDDISDRVRQQIRRGLATLDRNARRRFRAQGFAALSAPRQDALLRVMESSRTGIQWLRTMIELTLECFFGDPVQGGNPNEIGWKWIEHRPGYPRPRDARWRPRERA